MRQVANWYAIVVLLLVVLAACRKANNSPSIAEPIGQSELLGTATSVARAAASRTATASPLTTSTPTVEPPSAGWQLTSTPVSSCTPRLCADGERLYCSGECPGDCGLTCATLTPTEGPVAATREAVFDGENAFSYLESQLAFGPRYPGSRGHQAVGDYIVEELQALGWKVEVQPVPYKGITGRNVIGRANVGKGPVVILGAHYDSRRIADESANVADRTLPVPGAVDGASGVAVLLELARTLDLSEVPAEIWLAFFDLEDQGRGGMPDWDWIVGSTYMAENLETMPAAMVLVDMIGDADQQLYYEGNSDPVLRQTLWQIAADLGFAEVFIPEVRHTMIDDHVPFARRGIPAVDIIDFDYPYWHTVEDTADKASSRSLFRVGRTLEWWLEKQLEFGEH